MSLFPLTVCSYLWGGAVVLCACVATCARLCWRASAWAAGGERRCKRTYYIPVVWVMTTCKQLKYMSDSRVVMPPLQYSGVCGPQQLGRRRGARGERRRRAVGGRSAPGRAVHRRGARGAGQDIALPQLTSISPQILPRRASMCACALAPL